MLFINGVLICLAIVLISYFFWNCCQKVFFIKRLHTLPGPKPLPLIGNIHHVLLKTPEELMNTVLKMTEDYSSPLQVWIGSKLLIGIYEPDQIKIILRNNNNIEKSIAYKFTSPFLGIGLLTAPASIWIRMRTAIAPIFSARMLQGFFNTFVEQSVIFAHKLEKVGLNENEINLQDYISNCTWRIACDSILGIKLEPHKNNQCVKAIQRLKNIFARRITNIFLFPNVIFNLTALGRVQAKTINTIRSLVDEMIQQRTHESNNLNTTKDENKRTHRTFFDILMEALHKKNLTQEEIYDNILTMLITASDSITVTMNFTLFMLANFPEIQEKVYKELLEIYGTETVKSAPIKYDDLQYMHYLDRVIKETMRIFPPAPLIGRIVTEDLKMGKFVIPKNADVIIPIIKLHRNEKYWSNPLVFDPDRFLPEKIKNSDLYYNAPFGDGPRICIGMKYAMICMKVILTTLIRTFVLKVDESIEIDKIKLKFDTLLASVEPLKVKIKKR